MSRPTKNVSLATLAALIDSGAILNAYITEDTNGGFHIICRATNGTDHYIRTKRGENRTFSTIDTAARLLRDMGISRIHLQMNEYTPNHSPLLK